MSKSRQRSGARLEVLAIIVGVFFLLALLASQHGGEAVRRIQNPRRVVRRTQCTGSVKQSPNTTNEKSKWDRRPALGRHLNSIARQGYHRIPNYKKSRQIVNKFDKRRTRRRSNPIRRRRKKHELFH